MSRGWFITLTVIVVSALAFFITDCSTGKDRHLECSVSRHRYVAAWTEYTTSTDGDGNVTCDTTYHPEEFHILTTGEGEFDILVKQDEYDKLSDEEPITVRIRVGKWTGIRWIPTIVE